MGFVGGFTLVFVALGALAGSLGSLLKEHQTLVNILCGLVVIFFGLNFLGVIRLNLFKGAAGGVKEGQMGFFSALVFGMVFAVGWTPCVGAFLGFALMLASQQGQAVRGMLLLLVYSLGLGIPFLLSALLIDYLKGAFDWIKAHYDLITKISGLLLIVIGILMATGLMNRWLNLLG